MLLRRLMWPKIKSLQGKKRYKDKRQGQSEIYSVVFSILVVFNIDYKVGFHMLLSEFTVTLERPT